MALIGENFPPPTGGMVQSIEPNLLAPNECAVAVDQVFHVPGELRTRGLFWTDWNYDRGMGSTRPFVDTAFRTVSPTGLVVKGGMGANTQYLVINNDRMEVGSTFETLSAATNIGGSLATAIELYAWSAETTPQGVTILSGAPYRPDIDTPLTYLWAGSTRATAGVPAGMITYSSTSTAVTGVGTSFTTDCPAGTFLESGSIFIGIVKSVESNTALTLWDIPMNGRGGALATNAYALYPIRPRWAGGTITTRTTQTVAIGNGTRFNAFPTSTADQVAVFARNANLNNTAASIFLGFTQFDPATDNPLNFSFRTIGSATTANALASTDNAYWFGYRRSGTDTTGTEPLYKTQMTSYAGRYWYTPQAISATTEHRLYFSSLQHFADIDMSSNGNWINIPASRSNPVVKIIGSRNCLLIFLRNDVYCLTGTSPANFTLTRISGENVIGPNAICRVNDGVAWTSANGIFFFDGSSVKNLTAKSFGNQFKNYHGVGTMYRQFRSTVFSETDPQLSNAVLRYSTGYLILSLNNAQRTRNAVRFPSTDYTLTSTSGVNEFYPVNMGIVVYLPTLAAGIWTNLCMLDMFTENEADYLILQCLFAGSTSNIGAQAILMDDLLDLTKFQYSDGGYALSDSLRAFHPNGGKPWCWGTSPDSTAVTIVDACTEATTSAITRGTFNDAHSGVMNMYEHRAKLTNLAGGAAVGSWVASDTFAGGGYLEDTGLGIEQVISIAESSNRHHGIELYFPSLAGTQTVLVKSGLFGWRFSAAAGTCTVESIGFTSDNSWTVSGVTATITTFTGPSLFRAAINLPSTGTKGIKCTSTTGLKVHWSLATFVGSTTSNPHPYVQTRAVGVSGSQFWLRKLRMHYASTGNVGVHTISNNDGYRKVGTGWTQTVLPSTGMTIALEPDVDLYQTQDVQMGRVAEMWQFCLGLDAGTNNRFIWKNSQVFGKPRRQARN